jgi:hypothetical protein
LPDDTFDPVVLPLFDVTGIASADPVALALALELVDPAATDTVDVLGVFDVDTVVSSVETPELIETSCCRLFTPTICVM